MSRDAQSRMLDKVVRWILFIILMACLPFIIQVLFNQADSQPVLWTSILGRGDLLLAAVGIAVDGASDLLGKKARPNMQVLIIVSAAMSWFILAVAMALYGYVAHMEFASPSGADRSLPLEAQISGYIPAEDKQEKLAHITLWIFYASVLASGACKVLSEVEDYDRRPSN